MLSKLAASAARIKLEHTGQLGLPPGTQAFLQQVQVSFRDIFKSIREILLATVGRNGRKKTWLTVAGAPSATAGGEICKDANHLWVFT